MAREIQTTSEGLTFGRSDGGDEYLDKLIKYIPAEAVAAYLAADGIARSSLKDDPDQLEIYLWVFLAIGLIGTPLYLWRVANVSKPVQLGLSFVAFALWVFAIGGAFTFQSWYQPFVGALLVTFATFVFPIVNPPE